MSGIMKSFKKVWRPIEKLGSKIANVGSLGLHNKTKKIRHKIIKSKVFKVVVAAAAIYFGGAALLSMAQGGTAAAGIGSAWGGVTGAGSALAAGNFSGAASALGSGFTSGAAAGASGTFAAGQAAATGAISANAAGVAASSATAANIATSTAGGGGGVVGGAAKTTGLLGLGEAGSAALITGGVNMAGQMIQGHAAEKQAEEQKKNLNYWGVNGNGNGGTLPMPGLLTPALQQPNFGMQPQQPRTIDELIKRQQQQVNQYPTWG